MTTTESTIMRRLMADVMDSMMNPEGWLIQMEKNDELLRTLSDYGVTTADELISRLSCSAGDSVCPSEKEAFYDKLADSLGYEYFHGEELDADVIISDLGLYSDVLDTLVTYDVDRDALEDHLIYAQRYETIESTLDNHCVYPDDLDSVLVDYDEMKAAVDDHYVDIDTLDSVLDDYQTMIDALDEHDLYIDDLAITLTEMAGESAECECIRERLAKVESIAREIQSNCLALLGED